MRVEEDSVVLRELWLAGSRGLSGAPGGNDDHRLVYANPASHRTLRRERRHAIPRPRVSHPGGGSTLGSYPQSETTTFRIAQLSARSDCPLI